MDTLKYPIETLNNNLRKLICNYNNSITDHPPTDGIPQRLTNQRE